MYSKKQPSKTRASHSAQRSPPKSSTKLPPVTNRSPQKTGPIPAYQLPISTPSGYPNENAYGYSDMDYGQYAPVGDFGDGEFIKVALRVRPMNTMELMRGDEIGVKVLNDTTCQINNK